MKAVDDLVEKARSAGVKQRIAMPTTTLGVVTDVCDPLGRGRVQCALPRLDPTLATAWAPLVALGAGPQAGWFFLPKVGDEVLVGFENGDIKRPVVLGMLWSNDRSPPHQAAGSASTLLTIASAEKGARLEFDDEAEEIRLFAPGDKTTLVLGKNGITMTTDGDVALTSMQGEVTIAGKEIKFTAQMELAATGMQESALIGSSEVKVTGKPSIQAAAPQLTFGGTVSGGGAAQPKNQTIDDPLG